MDQLFIKEQDFDERLQPEYVVTSEQICERIKKEVTPKSVLLHIVQNTGNGCNPLDYSRYWIG